MRKVELTEAEAAAVVTSLEERIVFMQRMKTDDRRLAETHLRTVGHFTAEDEANMDYWNNVIKTLRMAKAKLEHAETEGDDAENEA